VAATTIVMPAEKQRFSIRLAAFKIIFLRLKYVIDFILYGNGFKI